MQTLTLKIPLAQPTRHKERLMLAGQDEYRRAGEWYLEQVNNGKRNGKKAIHKFYSEACALFSVNRASLQEAAFKAEATYRSFLSKKGMRTYPTFKVIPYRLRQDSFHIVCSDNVLPFIFKFPTVKGRNQVTLPLMPNEYMVGRLNDLIEGKSRQGSCEITQGDGKWFANVSVVYPTEEYKPEQVIGVDMGIVNLCVLSTNKFFRGKQIRFKKERKTKLRQILQLKGRLSRVKKRQGKERRWMKEVNHSLSREIVNLAKEREAALAIENLRGIRSRSLGTKRFNRMLSGWSFAQLRSFIEYKAKLAGVPVLPIDPRSSSTTCSRCSAKGVRNKALFSCPSCGLRLNSDLNAARILCQRGISFLAGELSPPYGQGLPMADAG